MEEDLQQNNAREVWRGLEKISGHNKGGGRAPESGDQRWANELNLFFNRFDSGHTTSPTLQSSSPTSCLLHTPSSSESGSSPAPSSPNTTPSPSLHLPQLQPAPFPNTPPSLCLTANQVRNQLRKTKARKAAGPDGISSRLLKDCADQLYQVVLYSSSAVEDFLCGSGAEDRTPQGAQPLQTCGPDFSPYKDHGEAHLEPPLSLSELNAGPPAVRLPARHWGG
ncbi:hypothetical protein LDENG_00136650 [Lucifuga dentata]|nr:hypothetical protein LDENG_00136650 [Lucifuga dentata]